MKKNGSIGYFFNNIDCAAYGTKICKDSIKEVHLAMGNYNRTTISFKAIANLYGIPCKNCRFCSSLEYEYGWNKMKLVCRHTKRNISYGNEAEECHNYTLSKYEALKWASRIEEKAYIVIDRNGQFVFPIFVKEELEKMEDEMKKMEYEIRNDEAIHRDYEEIGELKEKNEILIEAEDDLNEQDIEGKVRNFEEEIREYEGGLI